MALFGKIRVGTEEESCVNVQKVVGSVTVAA